MGSMSVSVAAATAVAGYDLLQGEVGQQVGHNRAITGIMVAGSAAAGDTKVRLQVDQTEVGKYWNTATGYPTVDNDLNPVDYAGVPLFSKIHLIVEDPPATNPINVVIFWEDL